jgi:formylglycine-generating enzyme required for sulfatase activity
MVLIPKGKFIMGSDKSKDSLAYDNELPQRKVYLDGYYIYKHEVTVAQYRKFCQETNRQMPSAPPWGWQDNNPMCINLMVLINSPSLDGPLTLYALS